MTDVPQVLLLRHGRTDWNVQGRLQGRTDVALNDDGIAGAGLAARRLAGQRPARILSSPLLRASRTAQIIGEATGTGVEIDPRLIERDFGRLEGMLHSEILADGGLAPDFPMRDGLPGGAEPWAQVMARMLAAYRDLRGTPGPVLIVSHMTAMTALTDALGLSAPVFENSTVVALPG